jgi:hypothetical protein
MTKVMVDIETLATTPDAAIVSIGAVTFSTADGHDPIDEELHISVSCESCREHGRHVDPDTLEWWRDQPEEARHILQGGRPLRVALKALTGFCDSVEEVWANSPAFDCVILESAYRDVGVEPPWEFYKRRDVRTLRKCAPAWPDDREHEGTQHDALDDARHQARCASDYLAAVEEVDTDE